MNFFKADIKRIFTEQSFWLSIVLGALLLFGGLGYCLSAEDFTEDANGLYSRAQALALPFAAPLLAAMPYSVMIMTERETKFGALMILKQSGTHKQRKQSKQSRHYRIKRFFTVGLSGAAALFIPHAAMFAVCAVLGNMPDIRLLALPVTFGFGWAALSYGLTFVNRQRYVPLVMPQVLYLLAIYAFPYLKLDRFYPPLDISPALNGSIITTDRFVLPAVLALAGLFLTAFGKEADRQ